jgi:hypothetical protein
MTSAVGCNPLPESLSHAVSCFPAYNGGECPFLSVVLLRCLKTGFKGSILHGKDFPLTLMRGCAVEPVRHRQETLVLAAWRD